MLNATQNAISITVFFSMDQGKNAYTLSSIDKLRENLLKHHDISIKRSWCFACIKGLIDKGFITRKPRYRKDANGLRRQRTSMISFTPQGIRYLLKNGVSKATRLYNTLIDWWRRNDRRFPYIDEFKKGYSPSEHQHIPKGLKQLLEGMLNSI